MKSASGLPGICIREVCAAPTSLVSISERDLAKFVAYDGCPACGRRGSSEPIAVFGSNSGQMALLLCGRCGHVSYSKAPSVEWLSEYYSTQWDELHRSDPTSRMQNVLDESHWKHLTAIGLSKDTRILDFGCGFSNSLRSFASLGFHKLFGVEPSEHRAKHSAEFFPGSILPGSVAEAKQLAGKFGKFDLIFSNHVVEHLRDPFDVLGQLSELLADEGRFLIQVPDVFTESPVMTALFLPHLHLFNEVSAAQLFARLGFELAVWEHNPNELAVLAGRKLGKLPAGFRNAKLEFSANDRKLLAEFLDAPWRASSATTSYLSFWHPYRRTGLEAGFKRLDGGAATLAGIARAAPARLRQSILNRGRRYIRGMPSPRIVAVTGDAGGVPQLVDLNRNAPFLFK